MSYVYICFGINAKILDKILFQIYRELFLSSENTSSNLRTELYEHACFEAKVQVYFLTDECCSFQNYMECITLTGSCWEKLLPLHYLLNFLLWLPNQNLDLLSSAHGIVLHSSMGYELDRTPHLYCQILRGREGKCSDLQTQSIQMI